MKKLFQAILIFILLPSDLVARQNLKFTHLTTEKGLSQSIVQCILKDSKGFMWFGTRDGLNKYDGNSFTIYKYDADKPGSISNNYINDIFEDKQGNLWIATRSGLNRFDRKKNAFLHFNLGKETGVFVSNILEDKKGNVWLTTKKGLFRIDQHTGSFKAYVHNKDNDNSISDDETTRIVEDLTGDLWIGTINGLNRFNPNTGTFKHYKNNPADSKSLNSNYISTMYRDSRNNILIGTEGGGLTQYDRENDSFTIWKIATASCDLSTKNIIISINEGIGGQLWIGTGNEGFFTYDYTTKSLQCHKNDPNNNTSLANNSIRCIYKDDMENMWLGTYAAGVELLPKVGEKFTHFKTTSTADGGLNNNIIKAIIEDGNGNLWLSTDGGGINFFDRKNNKFTHLLNDTSNLNTISSNTSHCMLALNEDTLVFGHHRGGFDFYNKKTGKFTHFLPDSNNPNSISHITISSLYKDQEENLWIGTWAGGLDVYNIKTKQFKHYKNNPQDPHSISSNLVFSIKEDKDGFLWIATDKAIEQFDRKSGQFTHYSGDSSVSNVFYCIHIDKKNNIWTGTLGEGLMLLNKKTRKFTVYKEKDGLPSNIIESILEDSKGNLWLSTNNGICKFKPGANSFRNFSIEDGVQGAEFKRNSYFKNKKGEMYFGGINGFNVFNPDSIKDNPFIPKIVFTNFQIFNKSVEVGDKDSILNEDISETKEITLAYYHSVFTIKFAALNYIHPEKNQYAYMLEGFDKNWNYVGTEKKATYTNLDPGKYIFKVKASNNDGIWNEEGKAITIIITPPFWKTWWFRMLIISAIFGSAFAWYQARMRAIRKQKEILEVQVKERTEELQIANKELLVQKEELQTLAENLASQAEVLQEANGEIQILYSEIKDSIRAAQVIQNVILPSESTIKRYIPESFILYRPKDVVSGDFYWFDVKDDRIIIAAVDCTGHGVSGAFMSINGHHLLNQAINAGRELEANEILNRLNASIAKEFDQQEDASEVFDGMDIALCIIEKDKRRIQYAGANNPLYILRNNDILQVKANRYAVGRSVTGAINTFTNNTVDLEQGDTLYIFSDGYADQLGGPMGHEKFLYTRFRELLISMANQKMEDQLQALDKNIDKWRGAIEQMDDILVIGFKL